MDVMPQQMQTIIVFVPFVIMGAAVVALVVSGIYDLIRPLFDNRFVSSDAKKTQDDAHDGARGDASHPMRDVRRSPMRRLADWWRTLRDRNDDDDDEPDEDLDETTSSLLAMLPDATVVVNRHDEVVRAHPSAYTLGIVNDETIANAEVRAAIQLVRESGGRRRFDLTTHTAAPEVVVDNPDALLVGGVSEATRGSVKVQGVERPNWLKVTVGRVGEFVVVLIDDVSEPIRFAGMRDAFITNVSEQLLEPTKALEQLSDSLANDALDAEQVAWNAHQVRSSCDRLDRMVSDLLLLIKAQEPVAPSSANRLSVADLLHDACDATCDRACKFGVSVVTDCDRPLVVNGDREQLTAAVAKLIDNAIVYSPASGTVRVAASPSDDGDHTLIRVIDQGGGIPKDEQTHIFERFYRGANQTARSREGVGLGLAIVKHVALAHHGNVTVWSRPGSGSTFTLELPLAR
ncbi:Histidine kinase-, DNA gyrase B-, and HSP90-like ATPase [Bifidobacterium ramosum]|uniref:histidine kinase n=3 Tax=Bifidobacterium ramosum TaxID=1798158 RepID=A0A6L4X0W5_9BIFI|nr:Histidine kinase-, DNA gyrase B-, and HSP90-like ATPase [Bifidobacterium ramosum]